MFKSFGLLEVAAGNQREKTRAFESAQSALNYAEWWLNQGNSTVGVACSTTAISGAPTVCSNAFGSPTAIPIGNPTTAAAVTCGNTASSPWTTGVVFNNGLGNTLTINSGAVGGSCVYPMFYIQYLGPVNTLKEYLITAIGYGGNADAIAVVQSIFVI